MTSVLAAILADLHWLWMSELVLPLLGLLALVLLAVVSIVGWCQRRRKQAD